MHGILRNKLLIASLTGFLLYAAPVAAQDEDDPAPYRGSGANLRTTVSALSFDESAELDYNPYVESTVDLSAVWWFTDWLNTSASMGFSRELTTSDVTTQAGETWPSDLFLGVGFSRFANVRLLNIDLSGSLGAQLPISPSSQARTLLVGVTPSLSGVRRFDLLGGLTLGYSYRASKYFHEYTTSERETPLITSCASAGRGCEPFLNTGVRNVSWRQAHTGSVSLGIVDTLALSVSTSVFIDDLYGGAADERVSFVAQEPTDTRHSIAYNLGLSYAPMPSLSVGIGASTVNGQLAPNGSYQTAFFNRNTTLYLDVGLDVAGLVGQVNP